MNISVITSRLKALTSWLIEARYLWLSLAIIAIALIISLRPQTPEPVIRITGLILQLLGIGTVIWGISETRALFGHSSFTRTATDWLKRLPLLGRDIVINAEIAESGSDTFRGRMHVTCNPEDASVEARLNALEKNVSLIHERITHTQHEIDQEIKKSEDALKLEQQVRQADDSLLHSKLEATGTGGVHISAIGASWLFVGVILSTAAIEIAEALK